MNTFPANYKKEREAEAHENYTKDLNAMLARSKYNYPQETVRYERNVPYSGESINSNLASGDMRREPYLQKQNSRSQLGGQGSFDLNLMNSSSLPRTSNQEFQIPSGYITSQPLTKEELTSNNAINSNMKKEPTNMDAATLQQMYQMRQTQQMQMQQMSQPHQMTPSQLHQAQQLAQAQSRQQQLSAHQQQQVSQMYPMLQAQKYGQTQQITQNPHLNAAYQLNQTQMQQSQIQAQLAQSHQLNQSSQTHANITQQGSQKQQQQPANQAYQTNQTSQLTYPQRVAQQTQKPTQVSSNQANAPNQNYPQQIYQKPNQQFAYQTPYQMGNVSQMAYVQQKSQKQALPSQYQQLNQSYEMNPKSQLTQAQGTQGVQKQQQQQPQNQYPPQYYHQQLNQIYELTQNPKLLQAQQNAQKQLNQAYDKTSTSQFIQAQQTATQQPPSQQSQSLQKQQQNPQFNQIYQFNQTANQQNLQQMNQKQQQQQFVQSQSVSKSPQISAQYQTSLKETQHPQNSQTEQSPQVNYLSQINQKQNQSQNYGLQSPQISLSQQSNQKQQFINQKPHQGTTNTQVNSNQGQNLSQKQSQDSFPSQAYENMYNAQFMQTQQNAQKQQQQQSNNSQPTQNLYQMYQFPQSQSLTPAQYNQYIQMQQRQMQNIQNMQNVQPMQSMSSVLSMPSTQQIHQQINSAQFKQMHQQMTEHIKQEMMRIEQEVVAAKSQQGTHNPQYPPQSLNQLSVSRSASQSHDPKLMMARQHSSMAQLQTPQSTQTTAESPKKIDIFLEKEKEKDNEKEKEREKEKDKTKEKPSKKKKAKVVKDSTKEEKDKSKDKDNENEEKEINETKETSMQEEHLKSKKLKKKQSKRKSRSDKFDHEVENNDNNTEIESLATIQNIPLTPGQSQTLPPQELLLSKKSESKKQVLKDYDELIHIMQYLSKFDWLEENSLSHKLLSSRILTPAVVWFLICANYFPRNAFFNKDAHKFIQETFDKIKEIVPDYYQRMTKPSGKPDSAQKSSSDEFEELFLMSFSQSLRYYGSSVSSQEKISSLASTRTPNLVVKHNYTEQDDEWMMETRRYIYDSLKKLQNEGCLPVLDYDIMQNLDLLSKIDIQDLITLYEKELYNVTEENEKAKMELEDETNKILQEENLINNLEFDHTDIICDIKITFPDDEKFVTLMERRQNDNNKSSSQEEKLTGQEGMKTTQKSRAKLAQEDMVCQICNDGDFTDDNLIVFCSRCDISVHQKCYGIPVIPKEDWICDLCINFTHYGKYLRCPLCAKRGGAMKPSALKADTDMFEYLNPDFHGFLKSYVKTTNLKTLSDKKPMTFKDFKRSKLPKCDKDVFLGDDEKSQSNYHENLYYNYHTVDENNFTDEELNDEPRPNYIWVHISCVQFIPELYFGDKIQMTNVLGLENIDKIRFGMECDVCKDKKNGAAVSCERGLCKKAFHPECARRGKQYLDIRESSTNQYFYHIYCEKHTPLQLKRMLETKEKKKREEVNKFFKAIEKYYMTYLSDAPIYGLEIPPALLEDEEVKALIRKKKIVETPSHQKKDDGSYFLKLVERYRRKSCKFPCTITLQKVKEFEETTEFYEIVEIVPPRQPLDKNRELLENDPIWEIMQYKGLTPSQKFRKYKKLTHKTHKKQDDKESKAMSEHRELSEIREFSENKEMAESKELNEASETSEVHGFEPKDLQINIKDSPIFSDTESPKHKNQFESPALKKFESPKPTKPESPVSKEFDPPGLNIAESSMLKRIAPPTLMNIEPKSMMEIEIGKIVEPTIANKTEMSALNRIEPPTTSKTNEMLLEKSKGATISQIIEPPMKKTTETSMLDLIEPQNWNKIGQLGHIIGNQNESSTVFNLDEYMKVLQTGNKIEQPLFRKLESPPKIQKNESPKLKRPELTESKPSEFKLGLIKKSYLNNLIYDQNKTLPIDPFELMSRFSVVDDYDPKETLVCVCQKPYRGEIILNCEDCGKLSHPKCLGVPENINPNAIKWKCNACYHRLNCEETLLNLEHNIPSLIGKRPNNTEIEEEPNPLKKMNVGSMIKNFC